MQHTEQVLLPIWDITEEEVLQNTFTVRWGVLYNLEQLLEHAIVHILRHRRQIERFKVQGLIINV